MRLVASIEYSLNNGTYTTIIPRGTNAGSYTVKYKFVCDTNNYNVPAEATINISIAKANPSYTVPTNIETKIFINFYICGWVDVYRTWLVYC